LGAVLHWEFQKHYNINYNACQVSIMDQKTINKLITHSRLSSYQTIEQYEQNLILSKHYYIPLSILEVSLRNSINTYFSRKYGAGWLLNNATFLKQDLIHKINEAKYKLKNRNEHITQDKLIAELSFGFWTSLFKSPYSKQMRISDLKNIFTNLPHKDILFIDRAFLSKKLNHIRSFRNRIFHYEKIINNPKYKDIDSDINSILDFLDKDLLDFSQRLNNVS
jgi:hypothetical protein